MSDSKLPPRLIAKATADAERLAAKIKLLWANKKLNSWEEIETKTSAIIPPAFKTLPFTWQNICLFVREWVSNARQRMEAELKSNSVKSSQTKLTVATNTQTYNNVTLLPEQQSVKDAIFQDFFVDHKHHVAYQDGETGSGKTFVAVALIADCIKKNLHANQGPRSLMPYRYVIFTPKGVVEQYKRWIEAFGLSQYLGNLILVTSYSQLSASFGNFFYSIQYDPYTDKEELKIKEFAAPYLVILDEGHRLNNFDTQQTKFIVALTSISSPPFQLWMSATPFVTIENARAFLYARRKPVFGMSVNNNTWSAIAGGFGKNPRKPNIAATKRLRETLHECVYSFPKVRWPHKAINQVLIIDFEKEEHRVAYENAFTVYLERRKKAGKSGLGEMERFVALNQFRKAVEPFHVPAIIDRAMEAHRNNKAVVMGYAFRESVAQTAFRLHKLGIPREEISIIWGGKRAWRKDLILSEEERDELFAKIRAGEPLNPLELRQMTETLDYNTERIMAAETQEEQTERLAMMKELGLLGKQSANQRQIEIDKFQSGQSKFCIFTLAAGGVGLSLDHCHPDLWPREGFITPVYSGPEFKQALGRTVRRCTLSDTYQYMCYMRGTVEEYHVAPLIDKKIKCIAQFTGSNFNIIDLDTMTRVEHKFRNREEVIADANNEDAQFTSTNEFEVDTDDEDDSDN